MNRSKSKSNSDGSYTRRWCTTEKPRAPAPANYKATMETVTEASEGHQPQQHEIRADFDSEGVYFYQAFNDDIADWALEHQQFGGPQYSMTRMTWIKPSFGWVLYRSGYGTKPGQTRVLKVKVSHDGVASILSMCVCKHRGGGAEGRIQWDPERDMLEPDPQRPRDPRRMTRTRSIQIGMRGKVLETYLSEIICIQDVTDLCRQVGAAHASMAKRNNSRVPQQQVEMSSLNLPTELPYDPRCSEEVLKRIGLRPGEVADMISGLGRGGVPS